jgi:hypothetical protein
MKALWSSREEAESVEEIAPEEDREPRSQVYSAPGFRVAIGSLETGSRCKVLDLGSALPENVEFLAGFGSYVQIVDWCSWGSSNHAIEASGYERLNTVQTLLAEHRKSFDLVLLWDLLNYLPHDRARRTITSIAELCLPGARIHAIVYAVETMPELPNRYRVIAGDKLAYEPQTSELRGAPKLPPAAVEKLLEGFEVEHSFVLQHGVHEFVAIRQRW